MRALVEAALVAALASSVFVVHDLRYVLGHPYWFDEAWVAVSSRTPLRDLPVVTGSSPLGWVALLRLVPGEGDQRHRLVPLAFAALTVAAAYLLGRLVFRRTSWSVPAGVLAAWAAMLAPSVLVRTDLKQYTADAFVAVTALVLVAALDGRWSRLTLGGLLALCWVGLPLSHVTVLVGPAAIGAVLVVQLCRGRWRPAAETGGVGLLAGAGMAGYYALAVRPHVSPTIADYWARYFLPVDGGLSPAVRFLGERADVLVFAGAGSGRVLLPLVLAGVATAAWFGRAAFALTGPLIGVAMLAASAAGRYPLLDVRTSHFALTIGAVLAALGAVGVARLVGRIRPVLGVAVVLAAATLLVLNAAPFVRVHPIPTENAREQARYVVANRRPGDYVLVDYGASYAFGYYYDRPPAARTSPAMATGFVVRYPDDSRIMVMDGRSAEAIRAAVASATRRMAATPGARLWIVRSHLAYFQVSVWRSAVREFHVTAIPLGTERVWLWLVRPR